MTGFPALTGRLDQFWLEACSGPAVLGSASRAGSSAGVGPWRPVVSEGGLHPSVRLRRGLPPKYSRPAE